MEVAGTDGDPPRGKKTFLRLLEAEKRSWGNDSISQPYQRSEN